MSRLREVRREDLDPEGQRIWDVIDKTRGGVWGPYAVLMHLPVLGEKVAAVGEYLRFHGLLPGSDRELAILAAAREARSSFEWVVHEPQALREGTSLAAIEALRLGKGLDELSERERLVVEVVQALFRDRSISDELFARVVAKVGYQCFIEIVTIAGFYNMLAFVLAAWQVPDPQERS
jgi:4-carboxymuconolactone decarboxylase